MGNSRELDYHELEERVGTGSEQEELTGKERKQHPLLRVQPKGSSPSPVEKKFPLPVNTRAGEVKTTAIY